MKTINCHNTAHLGDCIQTMHFLTNAVKKNNNINFNFACNPIYHNQLNELIEDKNLLKLDDKIYSNSVDTWISKHNYQKISDESDIIFKEESDQATFFLLLWKKVSAIMGIECPFNNKSDMIYNQAILKEESPHKNFDLLFINSVNMSIPFPNFDEDCNWLIEKTKNKKVITTRKVNNLPCTLDYNLSVVDIAKLSKNVKNIVAVNTGPLHLCMNKWTINNIDKFYIWCPSLPETFKYCEKFIRVKSLKEINENNII